MPKLSFLGLNVLSPLLKVDIPPVLNLEKCKRKAEKMRKM